MTQVRPQFKLLQLIHSHPRTPQPGLPLNTIHLHLTTHLLNTVTTNHRHLNTSHRATTSCLHHKEHLRGRLKELLMGIPSTSLLNSTDSHPHSLTTCSLRQPTTSQHRYHHSHSTAISRQPSPSLRHRSTGTLRYTHSR